MKQFIRWLSLVACVVLMAAWIVSPFVVSTIYYECSNTNRFSVSSCYGVMWVRWESLDRDYDPYPLINNHAGLHFETEDIIKGYGRRRSLTGSLGMEFPSVVKFKFKGMDLGTSKGITLPYWLLFAPLFLLTLKLWYRPIKNWWRGTNRQGFAVEVIDQKDESAKST